MTDIHNLAAAIRQDRKNMVERRYAELMRQLSDIREAKGLTYARVAARTQIDRSYIHLMEHCRVATSVTKVINLADALGYRLVLVPVDGDAPGVEPPEPDSL